MENSTTSARKSKSTTTSKNTPAPKQKASAKQEETAGANDSPMTIASVQDWMQDNGFVSISGGVRENENGYPFLTFMNDDNEAENVYFSVKAADHENAELGTELFKGFFDPFVISEYIREDGVAMTKIALTGGGNRTGIEDLF